MPKGVYLRCSLCQIRKAIKLKLCGACYQRKRRRLLSGGSKKRPWELRKKAKRSRGPNFPFKEKSDA